MDYGIRERRKELRMSQMELSKKSGVSRQRIVALERGEAKNVLVSTLLALAKALDTTVDNFFCHERQNN